MRPAGCWPNTSWTGCWSWRRATGWSGSSRRPTSARTKGRWPARLLAVGSGGAVGNVSWWQRSSKQGGGVSDRERHGGRSLVGHLTGEGIVMGLLDSLLQGGPDRDDYQDFLNRYDQGSPYAGISDDEAIGRYQQVAPELSPDTLPAVGPGRARPH